MTRYVRRRADGTIGRAHRAMHSGYAKEEVADDDPASPNRRRAAETPLEKLTATLLPKNIITADEANDITPTK
jgi:hypothetical protein